MAKRRTPRNNTSSIETNTFVKGMVKDFNPSYVSKQNWTHARNAANNSEDGDAGVLGNEPANLKCAEVPYTIIGTVHQYADQWVLFSTDDTNSEIGIFDDSKCEYTTLVNDSCLSFNRENLIIGAAKENFDCSWQVYWDDGLNPSRTLNLDNIPYKKKVVSPAGSDCIIYDNILPLQLDCEQLRLAPLLDTPNINLTKAIDGGQLRNGSYQAFIAYTENEQKVTDYIGISNIQSIFDHENGAGALDLTISNLDEDYEFFELVILSNNQNNYVAKKIGLYSTKTKTIGIDFIDPALPSVPIEQIPLRNPAYEKSDAMYVVNDYLIRQGPTEQFDFNYQPLANKIKTRWVVAEYSKDYYRKGGNKTGLMRDEQYAFFIRWIYNTGERSASYHIPGRAPLTGEDQPASGTNAFTNDKLFQVKNTANLGGGNTGLNIPISDGGTIIAKGTMAYWESSEKYPDQQPDIWGSLCGKHIRHHKMPTEELHPDLHIYSTTSEKIRILGVEFYDIQRPVDNAGNIIENIVGYEFLRGSREGAKSILGKGIFRNMRTYNVKGSSRVNIFPNYPYNDLRPDPYFHASTGPANVPTEGTDTWSQSKARYQMLAGYRQDAFTFHSPELMFKRPFLNAYETRIYGELSGKADGQFIVSEKHPQQKLLRKTAIVMASVFGMGYGLYQLKGERGEVIDPGRTLNIGLGGDFAAGFGSIAAPATSAYGLAQAAPIAATKTGLKLLVDAVVDIILDTATDAAYIATGTKGGQAAEGVIELAQNALGVVQDAVPGTIGQVTTYSKKSSPASEVPVLMSTVTGIMEFANHFAVGTDEMIELLYNIMSFQDTALKYNSHGFYENFSPISSTKIYRTRNLDSNFIGSALTNFGRGTTGTTSYKINNLLRPKTVAVNTENDLDDPTITDVSRFTIGQLAGSSPLPFKDLNTRYETNISCLYGSLKYNFENQYGQLNQIKQVMMRGEVELLDIANPPTATTKLTSNPIFSGDVYIGRYTEKTIMPIFTDFLYGQPNGYSYNYHRRVNIPYPRYWVDSTKYDISQIIDKFTDLISIGSSTWSLNNFANLQYYVDRPATSVGGNLAQQVKNAASGDMPLFNLKNCYMYTHVNGVQDFYVESEVNLAQRDWEEAESKRHYDEVEYTEVDRLFDAAHIGKDNFYRYDYSLSASRFITNLTSFGSVQPTDYDPYVAEKCYSYYPKRLIYSLQAKDEAKKDFWRVFLPNNYKDFKNKVTVIKPISKSGSIIFFPYQSPQIFQGVDQLQTDLGTKLTIGDGGLFSQPFQNIVNSDLSNEYGSCESARSVLNTPMGLFYISQAQGKVFQYAGQLVNIANQGMKWWFNKYLPSQLIKQFPALETLPLGDNPVVGVGCQVIYDINNDVVYFCKRDFKLKDEYTERVRFNSDTLEFILDGGLFSEGALGVFNSETRGIPIELGDPQYFEDCSWTVSYDPKAKAWVSFHDWHPELCMSSIKNFLTTKTITTGGQAKGSIWRHNSRCDLFANYYGVSYPWEVELTENTGQMVNTVRSLEYQLESYVYKGDLANACADDRWHDLNFNFDELIVYNSEQVSGKLNLVLSPSFSDISDPFESLNYPQINFGTFDIDILYTKEEQKYRVNQFWDVTKDRGEFTSGTATPAEEVIFNTQCNGYIRTLNPINIDLGKVQEQRKKFRHYYNKFVLRRLESDNRKMLLKLNNTKLNVSMR